MTPQEFKNYTSYLIDLQVKYLEALGESTDFPLCDWASGLQDQLDVAEEAK